MRDSEAWRGEVLEWKAVKIRPSTLVPFLLPGRVHYALSVSVGGAVFSAPLDTFLDEAVAFALDRIIGRERRSEALSEEEYSTLFDGLTRDLEPVVERIVNSAFVRRGVVDREFGFGRLVLRRALSVLTDLTEEELLALYRSAHVEEVLES